MQLKRIFAIFLAAALIFSVAALGVGAEAVETFEVGVVAESATPVSTSPKIFNSGDEVSVKISVDQNTGISFLRFVIYFDTDALEYVDYTSNDLFGSGESVQVKNGYIIYYVDLIKDISANQGDLLSLNFKIKSGYCGDTEIYTELVNNRKANCARYDSDAKNAYVPFVAGNDTFTIHSIISADGVVAEPVCTANGYTTYKCTECGEDVIGNIVDALDHDLIHHDAKAPTCTEIGWDAYDTCSRCDYTTYHELDALNHDLVHHDAKAPTCTEIGWDAYDTCSRCDYTTYHELDALNHDLVHHDAKTPTCTEIGWDAYDTCSRCDYTTYVEKPALGHDFADEWAVDVEPTTSAPGQKSRHCSRCDEVTDIIEIPKLVEIVDSSKIFTDVKATSWAKPGVDYVVSYGYMSGVSSSLFDTSGTMTRAMIVTVLWRIEGSPEPEGENPFDDLQTNQTWYHKAVLWAYENGIVAGTSKTTFDPTGAVTREQMATFLYRYAKYKGYDTSAETDIISFPDADNVGSWAKEALAWANSNGLITGSRGDDGVIRLDPQGKATREQVATILMRFCNAFSVN